ncbi:hypothetical protein B0O80DRAFT_454430 [Mortierella sp. GBAus27b]|nr:hypothetical protein B0O80DRAFT_454430 [Mortierella sp. GBAus27b]
MEDFVLQCPMLETLVWRLKAYYYFRMNEFCQRLAAQTWPHLDSLEITGQQNFISGQEHALLLLSTERPFKVLDLKINTVEEQAFVLLQAGGHFGTLTKMDLTLSPLTDEQLQNGGPSIINVIATQVSKWTITVFESCPLLEHIVATVIHARDIIDSKPWVCHRLKKFEAMINMDIIKQSSTQTTYTADDKRQCYQVFERLGLLRQLNVLNLNSPNLGRFRELKLVSLPLELRMGLGHLSTLRDLEWIGYHGFQDIRMVDMEWMLQHWNRLRKITGEWIAMKLSKTFGNMPVRSYLIMEALRARKVEVPESWSTIDREVTEYMNRRRLAAVCDTDSSDSESEGERRTNS